MWNKNNFLFSKQSLFGIINAQTKVLDKEIAELSNEIIQNNEESELIKKSVINIALMHLKL